MVVFSTVAVAAPMCREILKPLPPPSAESFQLALEELAQMRLDLDLALSIGQGSQITLLKNLFPQKAEALYKTLEAHGVMTREEAKAKIREFITRKQNHHEESSKKENAKRVEETKTVDDVNAIEGAAKLNPVAAGGKITKPFFMSQTPITQRQWAIVASLAGSEQMSLNPSVHHGLKNAQEVVLPNGEKVKMQPENPVEYVNAIRDPQKRDYYESVHNFIDYINGMSKKDDPMLYQLISGHKKGMIYSLPSQAQMEHVALDLGQGKEISASKLHQYAHIDSSYQVGTMPVASLKPFEVAGGKFFDLLGNVATWTSTTKKDGTIVVKGGNYRSTNQLKIKNSNESEEPTVQSELIGFRIVGELP